MLNTIILFRKYEIEYDDDEIETMKKYFPITSYRTDILPGDLVIGRYSVLPFYKEQAEDMENIGAKLINSYSQHRYIANMGNWYSDLEGITPKSWPGLSWIDEDGPYVLKGETNSRRQKWLTHMFAKNLDDAKAVHARLSDDTLLTNQTIWIRKFEKFESCGKQVNGMPISREFRFFICDKQILSGGFYWSSCIEDVGNIPVHTEVPRSFLNEVIERIGNNARFYALDVAQKETGEWMVVELNDGQMSGLSENKAEDVFRNLKKVLDGEKTDWK
jgi:hypothetical protein